MGCEGTVRGGVHGASGVSVGRGSTGREGTVRGAHPRRVRGQCGEGTHGILGTWSAFPWEWPQGEGAALSAACCQGVPP